MNNIIAQTAKDYDMEESEVESVYRIYKGYRFYEVLEEKLKERRVIKC